MESALSSARTLHVDSSRSDAEKLSAPDGETTSSTCTCRAGSIWASWFVPVHVRVHVHVLRLRMSVPLAAIRRQSQLLITALHQSSLSWTKPGICINQTSHIYRLLACFSAYLRVSFVCFTFSIFVESHRSKAAYTVRTAIFSQRFTKKKKNRLSVFLAHSKTLTVLWCIAVIIANDCDR